MNLLAALFMTQLLYVVGVGEVQDTELCIGLAFALQYMRLTVFCWMLLMSHHMYFTFRDNTNLLPHVDERIRTSFWQFSIFGWCSPVILLFLSIFLQFRENGSLLKVNDLKATNCWFLSHDAFLYGFTLPVVFLIFLIFCSFVRTAFVIRQTTNLQIDKKTRDKMRRKRNLQLFLFIKLTFVISTVFFLSVAYKLTKIDIFWITFNIMQGLQGIIIALCVTCNCQVLKIYTKSFHKRRKPNKYGGVNKELSKSTSLQMLTWDPTPDSV
ncbi:hypothetical protein RUM43_014683 [Polyplax serrata]|uniref:G-protein coupled receptors family 2 profile 2 domain-containing protein n=1 Tax=Polyplax serrata TaxID=468196 RepID=A0AAN8S2J5_POLSC